MSSKFLGSDGGFISPLLETLDQRLLLTTLHGGDYFIYTQDTGGMVRVDLKGAPTDIVELFGYDQGVPTVGTAVNDAGKIVDLVGLLNGTTQVGWSDGLGIVSYPTGGGDPAWVAYSPTGSSDPTLSSRGAANEVYAIYVVSASANTILTFTKLAGNIPAPGTAGNGLTLAAPDQFAGGVPLQPDPVVPNTFVNTPGGGTVSVGAYATLTGDTGDVLTYLIEQRTDRSFSLADANNDGRLDNYDINLTGTASRPVVLPSQGIHAGIEIAPGVNMGKIIIPGTTAGLINSPSGSIDTLEMGYYWAKTTIGQNLGYFISMFAGGRLSAGQTSFFPKNSSGAFDEQITVGGNIGEVDVDGNNGVGGGIFYSPVYANNLDGTDTPSNILTEHEYYYTPRTPAGLSTALENGLLATYVNDSQADAEFVSSTTGDFYILGALNNLPPGNTDVSDWYGLPLMAGQTVTIDGGVGTWNYANPDSGMATSFIDAVTLLGVAFQANLLDSQGHLMATLGYETVEDRGTDSLGITQKPITFTAASAGIYYIQVTVNATAPSSGQYTLKVTGGTNANLGAIVATNIDHSGTQAGSGIPSIFVGNGGTLGAVEVVQGLFLNTNNRNNYGFIKVQGTLSSAGQITAVYAGYMGGQIESDGNIGAIRTTGGPFGASVIAGTDGGLYNHNAFIQNVDIAGIFYSQNSPLYATLAASGSIGTIHVVGDLNYGLIYVNYDGERAGGHSDPYGTINVIDVTGNWGSGGGAGEIIGVPQLMHGYKGNIGYVYVGGTIYVAVQGYVLPASPITFTGGTHTLLDDGGGTLTVNAPAVTVTGTTYTPTISYTYIGVDDANFPIGGGGVIANLTVNGNVNLTAAGLVEIGNLAVNAVPVPPGTGQGGGGTGGGGTGQGTSTPPAQTVTLGGTGEIDIYYVQCNLAVASFINSTKGRIVSGSFTGDVTLFDTAGSVGGAPILLDTASPNNPLSTVWILGHSTIATTGTGQFGYYGGYLNGLSVTGNVTTMNIDGGLQDLNVSGTIGNLKVNADGRSVASDGISTAWDGIYGVVLAGGITLLDVGDGLADDGSSTTARAGIFSNGTIGTIQIEGPLYTVHSNVSGVLSGIFGGLDAVYGELNGCIIAAGSGGVNPVAGGKYIDAIGQVIGTDGATCTALIMGRPLDSFNVQKSSFVMSGGVGTVSFSGVGASIYNTEIDGIYVRKIFTSVDSDGMNWVTVYGSDTAPDTPHSIGDVTIGGPGMQNSTIQGVGGDIGPVKGNGKQADMLYNYFIANSSMVSLTARYITGNEFHMPGAVGIIKSTLDMGYNTAYVGGLGTVTVGGDFTANSFTVASVVKAINIAGAFDNSYLALSGPSTANLMSLSVNGDISGVIQSAGHIGKIITKTGAIYASIETTVGGWNNDVDLIQTAKGFTGADANMSIAGTLKKLVSYASLGDNPIDTANGLPQLFEIKGDLQNLQVTGSKALQADLYADISVGGNIGTMNIDGTLYGIINVNGNVASIKTNGSLGGLLDTDGDGIGDTARGRLSVLGVISKLSMPQNANVYADITVGGSMVNLALKGASIIGNIESLYGDIGSITVTNGNISGTLTAGSIGKVAVTGGSITGDITATEGSIKSLTVNNGSLGANVTAQGTIDLLSLISSSTTDGKTIQAGRGIGTIKSSNRDFNADIISGRGLANLTITGGGLLGDITTQAALGTLNVSGLVDGSVVNAGSIGKMTVGGLNDATIASARDIGQVAIKANMEDSYVLAGVNVGADGLVGTADDVLHSGSITGINITGTMTNSVIAAGVDTGIDGTFLGDNELAAGTSYINKMSVKGGIAGTSAVLAESGIDPAFVASAPAGVVTVYTPTPAITAPFGADVFGNAPGIATTLVTDDGLVMTLTGDGLAQYDGLGNLYFEGTTAKSTLTITSPTGLYPTTINITGGDDSLLGSLSTDGNVEIGTVNVDGLISKLTIGLVDDGATWTLPGGVGTASVANGTAVVNINNVNVQVISLSVTTDDVGTWTMQHSYAAGQFSADNVGTFSVAGNLGALDDQGNILTTADITVAYAKSIIVTGVVYGSNGVNFGSDIVACNIVSWNGIGGLTVGRGFAGHLNVYNGDLGPVNISATYSLDDDGFIGTVNVGLQTVDGVLYYGGSNTSFTLVNGGFGIGDDDVTTSYRTAGGIGSFTVKNFAFSGLLAAWGDIKTLTIYGDMIGKIWSGGNITTAKFGSMDNGLLMASGDILTVTLTGWNFSTIKFPGDMTNSYILAGFNPGDAGCDLSAGQTEFANLQIDAVVLANAPGLQTSAVDDEMAAGQIKTVTISGAMSDSSITADVGPGPDGYVGTTDDQVGGTGYIGKVSVYNNITGSDTGNGDSYGVFAANNTPVVTFMRGQPFTSNGTAHVGSLYSMSGSPYITDVQYASNSVQIFFSHGIDTGTLTYTSVVLQASADGFNTLIDTTGLYSWVYDANTFKLTIYMNSGTFADVAPDWQLTLTDAITDNRGNALDGEAEVVNGVAVLPSGDRNPGGDFTTSISFLYNVLAAVPSYLWYGGCAPTSAGMLVGYYDSFAAYSNLIPGDASIQTTDDPTDPLAATDPVDQAIASVGYMNDYGLYNGVDDSITGIVYPDLSEPGQTPTHLDNSLADFMRTSRSVDGAVYGSTFPGNKGPGIQAYFVSRGYTAPTVQFETWGILTWAQYTDEINAGRPVMLGVDSDGDGYDDHAVIGIGYDTTGSTRQYICYNTWDNSMHEYDWAPVSVGQPFGVDNGVLVQVA